MRSAKQRSHIRWPSLCALSCLTALSFVSLTSLAAPPVPFYPDNVVRVKRISDSSVVVETKDSVTTVCAWYRKNLPDANGEMAVDGGAVIFYTHNGATADVEPGGSTTTIGISWDAKKFGPYVKK